MKGAVDFSRIDKDLKFKGSFCYDFHKPGKGCKSGKCGRSHRCPFKMPHGGPCDEEHEYFNHGK